MKNSNLMRKLISIFLSIGIIMTLASCKKAQSTTTEKPQASPPTPTMSEKPQKSEEAEAVATPSAAATPEPTASRAQVEYYSDGFGGGSYLPVNKISEEEAVKIIEETSKTQEEKLNIPVYLEDQLLLGKYKLVEGLYKCTWPGFDNSNSHFGGSTNKSAGILSAFPGGAWRDMEDGRRYLMYDTEKGTRLYIFFTERDNYKVATGYTLYSSKKLSYADMKSLKMGQEIEEVMAIDPTAQYVKAFYDGLPSETIGDYEHYWQQPITTVHLLTDGIMKITYERRGAQGNYVYTITDIEYHSDFKMESIIGDVYGTLLKEEIDYRIANEDYVD